MLKKALSLVLSLLLLTSAVAVSAASFSDVTSHYSWAQEAIKSLANNGVINGYPDGTFKPGNNITKEEAILLFGRMLGAGEELNDSIVTLSSVMYEDVLASYNTYAKDAAAYLMYKKVLTESDLATYLSSVNKGEPLKRYEAATLIAKCLGGDVWLKTNPSITLSFADAESVPSAAKGYVYFASEAGIMQGMEENNFVPMGDVTRAQIAVMIHRIFTQMNYTYAEGVISQINAASNTVTIRDNNGESETYSISKSVAVMLDGEQAQLTLLSVGEKAVLTFSNGALYSLDVVQLAVDDTFDAVYNGKATDSKGTTIKFTPINSTEALSYLLADNVYISYNGETAALSNISAGDFVHVSVSGAKVASITAEPKITTISGARVEDITFSPDVTITVRATNNELLSLGVKPGATIRRNTALTTFDELYIGDKVNLTLEYGQISAVVATGVEKNITGTIEEIVISANNSSLLIKTGNTSTSYNISRDVDIYLSNEAATLYDLRLGYEVELVLSSATITRINVHAVAQPLQITGQITLINTTYKMLVVQSVDINGNVKEENVFINSAKILDSNDGKIKTISNLKVGQNVTIAGSENLGVFEASSLMILSNTQ